MKSGMAFKTAIGDLSYDRRGDITRVDYVVYVWKKDAGGKLTYAEMP
jgi:branched-chain amino acid transport system substrate-binding protein